MNESEHSEDTFDRYASWAEMGQAVGQAAMKVAVLLLIAAYLVGGVMWRNSLLQQHAAQYQFATGKVEFYHSRSGALDVHKPTSGEKDYCRLRDSNWLTAGCESLRFVLLHRAK